MRRWEFLFMRLFYSSANRFSFVSAMWMRLQFHQLAKVDLSHPAVLQCYIAGHKTSSSSSSSQYFYCANYNKAMGTLYSILVKIQLSNIELRTKLMSFEKLPKVCDVRFCANVFRQTVLRRRTTVKKRRARRTWCEVVVTRSRSMTMIVSEGAVCWHSPSERCLVDTQSGLCAE